MRKKNQQQHRDTIHATKQRKSFSSNDHFSHLNAKQLFISINFPHKATQHISVA